MAFDLNQVVIWGRLTRDPELRYLPDGKPVCSFSIANNVSNRDDQVSFFDCVTFDKQADLVSQYLSKGRAIIIQGRLKQKRWQSPDGQNRNKIEIVADKVHFVSGSKGDDVATHSDSDYHHSSAPDSQGYRQQGSKPAKQADQTQRYEQPSQPSRPPRPTRQPGATSETPVDSYEQDYSDPYYEDDDSQYNDNDVPF